MEAAVIETCEHGIATIALNRPRALNAMTRAMRSALGRALARAEADCDVRAILLTGAGDRAFSAGLDVAEIGSDEAILREVSSIDPLINPASAVGACTKPVIGVINGLCFTGALEVALACDFLVASENAVFADTHAKLRILPVWGMSQRLPRAVGVGRAFAMSLTAEPISARTAENWGLVHKVVPSDDLQAEALRLAKALAALDSETIRANKALIRQGCDMSLDQALAYERAIGDAFNAKTSALDIGARVAALKELGPVAS